MDYCDEYCKHGYFDEKEHEKSFRKYVQEVIVLQPFDPKSVQKIRPGSNLQQKLGKECIFIIHSKDLGKLFFATQQQNQLNRWFKKVRSLAGDHGKRPSKSSLGGKISVMSESSLGDTYNDPRDPSSRIKIGRSRNQNKILKMLQELEGDFKDCKRNIKYVKECWEKNNESDDDSKYDDEDDEY
eukprot:UN09815